MSENNSSPKTETDHQTLKEIQEALIKIDEQRLDPELSKKERELLELSALALRNAERLTIARLQTESYKEMEELTAELNRLSKQIRSRVTRMNKLPHTLDKIETIIKLIGKIITEVGRW
jgi:DNA repair ATPase RecN